jgi:hypothetical protein
MKDGVLSSPFSSEEPGTASGPERGFRDLHDLSPEVLDGAMAMMLIEEFY